MCIVIVKSETSEKMCQIIKIGGFPGSQILRHFCVSWDLRGRVEADAIAKTLIFVECGGFIS